MSSGRGSGLDGGVLMALETAVAHSVSRRPAQRPPIKWLEIAAGWALAVLLQLVLLFLGFGLGAGAIDLRSAGEELRQQIASVLVADRSILPVTLSVPGTAPEDQRTSGLVQDRGMESSRGRAASVLPDPMSGNSRRSASIGAEVLDHAGPVVFWLAVWGAITWLASLFSHAPRSPSSAD